MRASRFTAGLALLLQSHSAPTPAAYVADVRGEWIVAGHPDLHLAAGAPLAAGDTIKGGPAGSVGQQISVLLRSGQLRTAHCSSGTGSSAVSCGSIVIPRDTKTASASWISRALEAIMSQFRKEPDRYASLVTRGVHGPPPDEAVILFRRDTLFLAPALTSFPAGSYTMCIARITDRPTARESSECLTSFAIVWDPPHGGTIHTTGLRPGLYQLLDVHGSTVAGAAWVLLASPAQFATQRAAFERLKGESATWQADSLPATAVRQMLRAQLAALAQPAGH